MRQAQPESTERRMVGKIAGAAGVFGKVSVEGRVGQSHPDIDIEAFVHSQAGAFPPSGKLSRRVDAAGDPHADGHGHQTVNPSVATWKPGVGSDGAGIRRVRRGGGHG